jgi:hypothetical protein
MRGIWHTVNNENHGTARGNTRNVKEINVILSERHDGFVVVCIESRLLNVDPRQCGRVCSF